MLKALWNFFLTPILVGTVLITASAAAKGQISADYLMYMLFHSTILYLSGRYVCTGADNAFKEMWWKTRHHICGARG